MKTLLHHILDIVQNSLNAKSTLIEICFETDKKTDLCILKIKNNNEIRNNIEGVSMQQPQVRKAITDFIQNNIKDIQQTI